MKSKNLFSALAFIIISLTMLSIVSANGWSPSLNQNLSAYWHFDEGSGNASDVLGQHNLLAINSPYYDTGKTNNAGYTVSGAGWFETKADGSLLLEKKDFSVNFWANWSDGCWGIITGGAYCPLVANTLLNSAGTGFGLFIHNNSLFVGIENIDALNVSAEDYANNQFQMLTLVKKGNVLSLYVNGTLIANATGYANLNASANSNNLLWVGRALDDGLANSEYMNEGVDELAIWNNRALNQSEITQLFNSGLGYSYYASAYSPPNSTGCYQETANASSLSDGSCSLNYSGTYKDVFGGSVFWDKETIDGNWISFVLQNNTGIVVYKKPLNSVNATIHYATDIGQYRASVPASCFGSGNNVTLFYFDGGLNNILVFCVNYSDPIGFPMNTVLITSSNMSYFNEEAISWGISIPKLPTIPPVDNTIKNVLSGTGAGIGIFLVYLSRALPPFLLILAFIGLIFVVALGVVSLIKKIIPSGK